MTQEERTMLVDLAAKHPDEVARVLADSLNSAAGRLGDSLMGRFTRSLATDTFKVYLGILGMDELVGIGALR